MPLLQRHLLVHRRSGPHYSVLAQPTPGPGKDGIFSSCRGVWWPVKPAAWPLYVSLRQVREDVQFYVDDLARDGAEEPIDAMVWLAIDSAESMREALPTPEYRKAHAMREVYIRETSVGIHSASLAREVRLV